MNERPDKICSRCGAAVPADAPEGLCPRCLGALNLTGDTAMPGAAVPPQPPPSPADIAPHFPQLEILECLGRGGMGVVYKARQKSLGRPIALKILAPERVKDPEFAARFVREAQALARLDHPHIVTVHDFGQADGFFYLLMEFVDGVNLRQAMRAGRFTPRQALAVVPQICEALQFAHDRGIVHRDIKPENILLDRQGRVKIADFGVAKIIGPEAPAASGGGAEPSGLTQAQGVVGTPRYMAPEQVTHPLDVDHRADIYSLGVVFYEMLTGELPAARIEAPSKKVVVDVRLDEVVLRALEKAPERRYQQAGEVGTLVETIATTPPGPARGPARKSGMIRLIEIFFDITFTSPAAILLLNISALGFLGFLSNLKYLPFHELRWCARFSGFFGFFGFIGVAFLVELAARRKAGRSAASAEAGSGDTRPVSHAALLQVKGPAIGLVVTGILNWIVIPLIVMVMVYHGLDPDDHPALGVVPIVALGLCSLMIFGGLKMKRMQSLGWGIAAAVLAILVSPGNIIGLPLGIWALVVLAQPDVRAAFRTRREGVSPPAGIGARVPPAAPGVAANPALQSLRWMLFGDHPERRHLNWPFLLFFFSTIGLWVNGILLAVEWVPWLLNVGAIPSSPGGVWQKLLWMAACVVGRRAAMVALNWSPKTVGWAAFAQIAKGTKVRIVALMFLTMTLAAVVAGGLGFLSPWMRARFSAVFADANSLSDLARTAVWIAIAVAAGAFVIRRTARTPRDAAQPNRSGLSLVLAILVAVAAALVIQTYVLAAYVAKTDAVSPEVPRESFVLAYKLARAFSPGDIIVYQGEGRAKLGRVATPGPTDGVVRVDRGVNAPESIPSALVQGKVIFNTRHGAPAEAPPAGAALSPGAPPSPGPAITRVVDAWRGKMIEGRGAPHVSFVVRIGEGSMSCGFLDDSRFTAAIERPLFRGGFNCLIKDSLGKVRLNSGNNRIGPIMKQGGRIVFREGTLTPEPDGSFILGEFRPETGAASPITVRLEKGSATVAKPTTAGDRVVVEDLALRLLAAIRDKEDAVLRDLAVDRFPGWRDALPQFAFEFRERFAHMTGKPFAVFPTDSLVAGDLAVVRCNGPEELKGFYLVLGFVRTPAGWRNWNLRNSPPDTPLQRHFDDFKAQLEKPQPSPPTPPQPF